MKYGVSIGRRQPMHRVHLDCIREITDAGLKPIILVGSVNDPQSPFYDPFKNPLTFKQEQEQLHLALPNVDYEILPIADVGNLEKWCAAVVALLGDKLSQSVMHYRAKQGDKRGAIEPLSASEAVFAKLGLKSWRTVNKNPADDAVNSSILREMPIDAPQFQNEVVVPDYIKKLVNQARAEHPDAKNWGAPTMRDISLWRMWKETLLPPCGGAGTCKCNEASFVGGQP